MDVSPAKRSYFTCANVWWKLLFHSTIFCELDLFYVFAGFPELSLTLQEIIQTKKDVPQSCGWKNTKFTCKLHKNCQADKFLLAGKIYIFSIVYLTGSSSQPV
jgi:hypothetical protein